MLNLYSFLRLLPIFNIIWYVIYGYLSGNISSSSYLLACFIILTWMVQRDAQEYSFVCALCPRLHKLYRYQELDLYVQTTVLLNQQFTKCICMPYCVPNKFSVAYVCMYNVHYTNSSLWFLRKLNYTNLAELEYQKSTVK